MASDLAPRLDDAGLVVRGHHADEAGARVGQFSREPVQVNHAVARDGNESRAFAEIMFRRFDDAGMFDGGNPDLALRVERPREMVHDRVVRLGRAAGPDDVRGMAAEERGEFFARLGQRGIRARAVLVRAGRVAADFLGGVQPGFARLAHDRRGGVVIEVNHRPDRIRLAARLASFLWAAVKAKSGRICAGVCQKPDPFRRDEFHESLICCFEWGLVELVPPRVT